MHSHKRCVDDNHLLDSCIIFWAVSFILFYHDVARAKYFDLTEGAHTVYRTCNVKSPCFDVNIHETFHKIH